MIKFLIFITWKSPEKNFFGLLNILLARLSVIFDTRRKWNISNINFWFPKHRNSILIFKKTGLQFAGLAQSISCRVATLDLGKSRVVECLQRVNDLRDLGTCASGVQEAIRQERYEEAARHIHRFLTLDTAVFKMGDHRESKGISITRF